MIQGLNYLKEYTKIVSSLSFKDFLEIIKAYAVIFDISKLPKESATEMTQSDYLDRMESCRVCPVRTGLICDPTKKRAHKYEDKIVSGCGCSLPTKQKRGNHPCPAGEWKVFNTQ